MSSAGVSPNIMVVDDEPGNLTLLENMLRQKGYKVRSFPRGRLALVAAAAQCPDLILLDVNMPEMNGYQVCERLKANLALAEIPVIFLSALNETEDKVKGFRSGGVDYILKPFQFEEVYARVETHLNLHELRQALKLQNEQLELAVAMRTRELAEAHASLTRLNQAKDDFLMMISHEFRTPLNGLFGVAEIVLAELPRSKENDELCQIFEHSRERIICLLDDALFLTQIDVGKEKVGANLVSFGLAFNRAIQRLAEFAQSRHVTVVPLTVDPGLVRGQEDLLVRALQVLMETAIRFSKEDGVVQVELEVWSDYFSIIIDAHGKTMSAPAAQSFFDMVSIGGSSGPTDGLGLAPAVSSRILSLFGATVNIENRDVSGIRLTLAFQKAKLGSMPHVAESASFCQDFSPEEHAIISS